MVPDAPPSSPPPTLNAPAKSPPPSFLRRWLLPILKFALAGGLLYYVLAKGMIDFTRLERLFLSPGWLTLAAVAFSAQMWIGAQRLRMLLVPQGVTLGYWTMLRLTYLGAFFDAFLVTSVGGDAVKAVYLARESPKGRRMEAVSILVLDRLMGLLGLLTLTLLVSIWQLEALWSDDRIRPYFMGLIGVSLFLIVGTGMLLSKTVHSWGPMQAMLRVLPMGGTIDRAYGSLQRFSDRPSLLFIAWGMSLCVHLSGVVFGIALLYGIGMEGSPAIGPILVAWFISNFISSFSPFGGVGTGQVAYDFAFKAIAGLPLGADLATAAQITVILTKSPGLVAWLCSKEMRDPEAPPSAVRNEV